MTTTSPLADDATIVQRILDHLDHRTTDLGDTTWTEPVANYSDHDPDDATAQAYIEQATVLVDAGAQEDREVLCAVQRGLASGANDVFTFGRFESALVHFHRTLPELEQVGVAA